MSTFVSVPEQGARQTHSGRAAQAPGMYSTVGKARPMEAFLEWLKIETGGRFFGAGEISVLRGLGSGRRADGECQPKLSPKYS